MGITDRCVEKKQMRELQVGDTIHCTDPDNMVEIMYKLGSDGIETEFMYEKDGEKGYWLVITEVEGKA